MSSTFAVSVGVIRGDVAAVVARVRDAARRGVASGGLMIENSAKLYAAVDTGTMKRSIQTTLEESGSEIKAVIGPQVDYAVHVEFGTRHMAAQPFMRPALEENRAKVVTEVEREVKGAL